MRDHLREHGQATTTTFYLLDEPGLDNGPNIAILLDAGNLSARRTQTPYLHRPSGRFVVERLRRIEPLVDVWALSMRLVSGLLSGDPRIKRIMTPNRLVLRVHLPGPSLSH